MAVWWMSLLFSLPLVMAAPRVESPPDPAFIQAEHRRLSEEMNELALRQHWAGVDARFRQCESLSVELTYQDYLNGAMAARGLGDVTSTYDRLRSANKLRSDKEVVDWLWNIDTNYGNVELVVQPPRPMELEPETLPFAPDQRAAVLFAASRIREESSFKGLLPSGNYSIGKTRFTVQPGLDVRLEVSARKSRCWRSRDPEPAATPQPVPAEPPVSPEEAAPSP